MPPNTWTQVLYHINVDEPYSPLIPTDDLRLTSIPPTTPNAVFLLPNSSTNFPKLQFSGLIPTAGEK